MIFHPRVGQRVCIHYARRVAGEMLWHGKVGVVRVVATGPAPRNVGVEVDGALVVVPRGNLAPVKAEE